MTYRVRQSSGACPASLIADTVERDNDLRAGMMLRDGELAVPDTLSAETDTLSCLDKPDKSTPPYRGGLSVSNQIAAAEFPVAVKAAGEPLPQALRDEQSEASLRMFIRAVIVPALLKRLDRVANEQTCESNPHDQPEHPPI